MSDVPIISIIDDDPSVRSAASRFVRSLGYASCTFASAEEFLQSAGLDRTSCVIADVQMTGMSGIEMQSCLAAEGRSLPIIFITAFPDESLAARALAAGAVCFLSKPFDCQLLSNYIDQAVKLSRPASKTV